MKIIKMHKFKLNPVNDYEMEMLEDFCEFPYD